MHEIYINKIIAVIAYAGYSSDCGIFTDAYDAYRGILWGKLR